MKRIMFLFAFLLIGLSIQSCREMGSDPWDDGNGDPKDTNNRPITIEKLVGTKWRLVSIERNKGLDRIAIPSSELYSISFNSATNASGNVNCNSYGAEIKTGANGYINFSNFITTLAMCQNDTYANDFSYGLTNANLYSATANELRISYIPTLPSNNMSAGTLVFAPYNDIIDIDDEAKLQEKRLFPMIGKTYTLYSFVDADNEQVMTDAQNCKIQFFPNGKDKGVANIQADCNTGFGDLTFKDKYNEMRLSNIVLTKIACPNQITANRFVEFLSNTAGFEYSDNGNTLTIWSSLTTFAESKMVLKVNKDLPSDMFIDIMQSPQTGVPTSSYSSFKMNDLRFDGQNLILNYSYNGKTADYQIMAYSDFEFGKSDPPVVVIDLVTNGSLNPSSQITDGKATLLLDAIRARILITSPGKTQLKIILRWEGKEIGQADVTL